MNNIIAYTILLIIVMYVLKSNIEKFAIDIGNTTTPPASNPLDIVSTTISSIGNTTQSPSNGIVDILSASIGNTPTPPAQPSTGGILSAGNTTTQPSTGGILSGIIGNTTTTPPAPSDDLEAKVAAFCKSVQ